MPRQPTKYKRRIKLIKPRLQFRLIGAFLGLCALSFLLQSLLIGQRLSEAAAEMPAGGNYLQELLPSLMFEVLLFSFGLLLPLIFTVGVLVTFRIAGPVYRFEQYLGQVARGEQNGPCRIRKGDELQDLCDRINEATLVLREAPSPAPEQEPQRAAV